MRNINHKMIITPMLNNFWSSFLSVEELMKYRIVCQNFNEDFTNDIKNSSIYKFYTKNIWNYILERCSTPPIWEFIRMYTKFINLHKLEEHFDIEDYLYPHFMDSN